MLCLHVVIRVKYTCHAICAQNLRTELYFTQCPSPTASNQSLLEGKRYMFAQRDGSNAAEFEFHDTGNSHVQFLYGNTSQTPKQQFSNELLLAVCKDPVLSAIIWVFTTHVHALQQLLCR